MKKDIRTDDLPTKVGVRTSHTPAAKRTCYIDVRFSSEEKLRRILIERVYAAYDKLYDKLRPMRVDVLSKTAFTMDPPGALRKVSSLLEAVKDEARFKINRSNS